MEFNVSFNTIIDPSRFGHAVDKTAIQTFIIVLLDIWMP